MLCEKAGLIEGNKVFLDATLLKANASLDPLTERRPYRELQTPEQYENKATEDPEDGEGSPTSSSGQTITPPPASPTEERKWVLSN